MEQSFHPPGDSRACRTPGGMNPALQFGHPLLPLGAPGLLCYPVAHERPRPASIRAKLANDIGEVPWSYLAPHAETGSLFFVDPTLALVDVGVAISANETDRVQHWLKTGDLVKIEPIHAAQWEDGKTEFEALVVLPFVLCRPV